MIERTLGRYAQELAIQYPVLTITGPRQSGKTTLCRKLFAHLPYVNLENIDKREYAATDPRGFLRELQDGAVLDEIQRVPTLVSYLQQVVDEDDRPGRFILTGSEQFEVTHTVSQSLAGRTAVLKLLPFTVEELYGTATTVDLDTILYQGFYPRIHDKQLDATEALGNYVDTYLQRDVRSVLNVRDLTSFTTFVRLCAAHTGNLVNWSTLGSACGIDQKTAKAWLSVLEASYIVFQLPPFFRNVKKRLTKGTKLYFYDVGLVCYLLDIREPTHLANHPLRGSIFECFVVADILKTKLHNRRKNNLAFYRDHKGTEVDLVFDNTIVVNSLEIKIGKTIAGDYFRPLQRFHETFEEARDSYLLYTGNEEFQRSNVHIRTLSSLVALSKL